MTISHGGDWNAQYPYDSFPAFENAFINGADAIKGDFRVSLDNIGMVMHSSPIEVYESLNCARKYVEKMSAAECQQCQMALTNYTFTSVPNLLSWAENKINVMFCVKRNADIPRAISTLIENNATHRAFLEIGLSSFLDLAISTPTGWEKVFYVVEISTTEDVSRLMNASPELLPRGFLIEFNNWPEWSASMKSDIAMIQSHNLRTTAATN